MSALSWWDVGRVAVSTGLLAGTFNQAASALRERWDRKAKADAQQALQADQQAHQRLMQKEEREHQQSTQKSERDHQTRLRREQAHAEARPDYVDDAQNIYSWINERWIHEFGSEVDVYPSAVVPSTLQTPTEVLQALQKIKFGHPTRRVRSVAEGLEGKIWAVFNEPRPVGDGSYDNDPTSDDYADWSRRVSELIEALHDPEEDNRPLDDEGQDAPR